MANIYMGTLELIGNTPLVEVTNIEKNLKLEENFLMTLSMTQKKKNIYMNHFLRYLKISITMKKKFAG